MPPTLQNNRIARNPQPVVVADEEPEDGEILSSAEQTDADMGDELEEEVLESSAVCNDFMVTSVWVVLALDMAETYVMIIYVGGICVIFERSGGVFVTKTTSPRLSR